MMRENDEYESWFRARVESARQAMRLGLGIPHEEVKIRLAEQRLTPRQNLPGENLSSQRNILK